MSDQSAIFSCAVCRNVRDDRWQGAAHLLWCALAEYLERYQTQTNGIELTEVYCPDCAQSYDRLVRYGGTDCEETS